MVNVSGIKWPVYLREKGQSEIYRYVNFTELQSDLEKIDIENEEYEAWDARGMTLKLSVQEPSWLKLEVVTPANSAGLASAIAELASALECVELVDIRLPYDQQINTLLEKMEELYQKQKWWKRLFHW